MTIQTVPQLPRKQIAWCNTEPPAKAAEAFERRGYKILSEVSYCQLRSEQEMSGVGAVVFTQAEDKPSLLTRELRNNVRRLLDLDCRVIIRPARVGDKAVSNVLSEVVPATLPSTLHEGNPPLPHAWVFEPTVHWEEVANAVVEAPAVEFPNFSLRLEWGCDADTSEAALLLRRAFSDCVEVHLSRLQDGKSGGVRVYKACAERDGNHGRWPQPYLVKIGPRKKIYTEFQNYELHVDPYIPFHLGPRVIRHRCCLGATEGIIVGHYVDESESLKYCAFDGRSSSAVAGLFDRTLIGWHRSSREQAAEFSTPLLARFPRKVDAARLARAKALGATLDLAELRVLFSKCKDSPVRVGRTHGDLHAANVRVRATDAVVIDFFAHGDNDPLILDAATLEVSLLIDGFGVETPTCQTTDAQHLEWFQSVRHHYEKDLFATFVSPEISPKSKAFWFQSAVAQIRRHARAWAFTGDQYSAALALALLTKATKDPDAAEPEATRRAAAYVFAETILVRTFGHVTTTGKAL